MNCVYLSERNQVMLKFIAKSEIAIFIVNILFILLVAGIMISIYIINLMMFENSRTAGAYFIIEIAGSVFIALLCGLIYCSVKYVRRELKEYDNQKLETAILMGIDRANYGSANV